MSDLRLQLSNDEGKFNKPYVDTVGKTTIGIGRNLTDVGVSDDEIELMLVNNIKRARSCCASLFPAYATFTQDKQDALANMAFNLGMTRLRGFQHMIDAVNAGDWQEAAIQAKSSHWYIQVGDRARRIVAALSA